MIEVENVVRTFKTERVIDNASFVLSSCGVSALVAPNGSGKTTLMSIIAGLMEPTEGRVLFSDGEGTSDVALLLAGDKNLYMKNTVMENLMYFAALNGYGRGDIQGDIDDVVSWFPELKPFGGRQRNRFLMAKRDWCLWPARSFLGIATFWLMRLLRVLMWPMLKGWLRYCKRCRAGGACL